MGKVTVMPSPPFTDPIWWESPTHYAPNVARRSPPLKPADAKEGVEGETTKRRPEADKMDGEEK